MQEPVPYFVLVHGMKWLKEVREFVREREEAKTKNLREDTLKPDEDEQKT